MKFIKSNDIKVYPASSRGVASELTPYNNNPESKLNTENNIVELVNRLAKIRHNTNSDSDIKISHSFVISDSIDNEVFEICINGYYFRIKNLSNYLTDFADKDNVYAKIIVKQKNTSYILDELAGYLETQAKVVDDLDNNGGSDASFIALSLEDNDTLVEYVTDDNTSCESYCLHILTKDDRRNWIIPSTSKIIITADYLGLSDYNGELHNLYEYFERDNNGNLIVKQTNKLQNSRTLWGQSFDGTSNVSGNLDNVGNITPSDTTYSIGNQDSPFDSTYAKKVYSDNLTVDTIEPGKSNDTTLGTSDKPFTNAYINSINSTSVYCSDSNNSNIGTSDKPFTTTYSTNINTNIINVDDVYSITKANIGSSTDKPTDIYATTVHANLDGNSSTATRLENTRTITVDGDASGSTSFDGSNNTTLTLDVTKAAALDSVNIGSNNKPVYFDKYGKPVAIDYEIKGNVAGNVDVAVPGTANDSRDGLMSRTDYTRLKNVPSNANYYLLPGATSGTLGGVKLSLDSNGILTIKNY